MRPIEPKNELANEPANEPKVEGAAQAASVVVASVPVSEEHIARRAYELWEARGCPPGDGTEDWKAAHDELLDAKAHSGTATATATRRQVSVADEAILNHHLVSKVEPAHENGVVERGRGVLLRWFERFRSPKGTA